MIDWNVRAKAGEAADTMDRCNISGLTRWQQFKNRLFPGQWMEAPEDLIGFADRYIMSEVTTIFDWKDRLRILVSGAIRTTTRIKTDKPVVDLQSESVCYVLQPGFHSSAEGHPK